MAKICGYCGNKIKLFSSRAKLMDGYICAKCLEKTGIDHFPRSKEYTVESIKPILAERSAMMKLFAPGEAYSSEKIRLDPDNYLFLLCGNLYLFSDLTRFHQKTVKESVTRTTNNVTSTTYKKMITTSKTITNHETTTTTTDYLVIDIVFISDIISDETLSFNLNITDERIQGYKCLNLLEQIVTANTNMLRNSKSKKNKQLKSDPEIDKTMSNIEHLRNLYQNGKISLDEFTDKKNTLLKSLQKANFKP